ncbi:MAG: lysylphosphatidylglycerol synthase transmembrane domain-containing protein [Bacteroidota bacterium]
MLNTLKNTVLLLFGGLLLWLALRNMPLHELAEKLGTANYWLLLPVFMVTLFGYWVRIKRWNLLYEGLNESISLRSAWVALCAGYLLSYVIPRAGEITRCLIIKRYHDTPVNRSLATIIVERFTDTFVLLMLIAFITLFNVAQTTSFFISNIIKPVYDKTGLILLLVLLLAGLAFFIAAAVYLKNKKSSSNWVDGFLMAMKELVRLRTRSSYLVYTVLIWCCYFLMTWIWIFAFDESMSLPWLQVFVIMVVGTIGKSVPIQGGGMGAYHYVVGQAFLFFGVSLVTGNALAIIIHGAQTLYTILTGLSAYGVLMYDEKKRNL